MQGEKGGAWVWRANGSYVIQTGRWNKQITIVYYLKYVTSKELQSHTLNILLFHKMILFAHGSLGLDCKNAETWKELKEHKISYGCFILQMWTTSKTFWIRSHTVCGSGSQAPISLPVFWLSHQAILVPPRLSFTAVQDPECWWPSSPGKS